MYLLIRLLSLFLSRRWGWMILGVVVAGIGVVLGASSHQMKYQPITNGNFTPYVVEGGTDYLQVSDGSTYYVIKESDLSPHFDGNTVFGGSQKTFAILTRSDTESVDVQLTDGTHLLGTGYRVERIAQVDPTTGQFMQIYSTAEYTQNPNGFYENDWPGGIGLIALGLLSFGLGLFAPRIFKNRRQKSGRASTDDDGESGAANALPAGECLSANAQSLHAALCRAGAVPAIPAAISAVPAAARSIRPDTTRQTAEFSATAIADGQYRVGQFKGAERRRYALSCPFCRYSLSRRSCHF